MDLHLATIGGHILIPAANAEAAQVVVDAIAESLRMELDSMKKSENRATLTGTVTIGPVKGLGPMCATTLERITRQTELEV